MSNLKDRKGSSFLGLIFRGGEKMIPGFSAFCFSLAAFLLGSMF